MPNRSLACSLFRAFPCTLLGGALATCAALGAATAGVHQALEESASSPPPAASEIVATYAQAVTRAELQEWRLATGRPQSTNDELDIAELILTKAFAVEAERLGLDQRAEVQFAVEMQQAGVISAALKRELALTTAPNSDEVEAKYQEIKDTFTLPKRWRIRNLYLWHPRDANAESKSRVHAEMESLRRRVLAGEDFAELATQHSDSQTRLQGGLIGNVYPGILPARLDEVLFSLEPGEVSRIVEGPDGPTLFFCDEILPKVDRTEEELREIARSRLANRRLKSTWNQQLDDRLAAAELRFNWSTLDSPPQTTATPETEARPLPLVQFAGGSLTVEQVQALLNSQLPASEPPQGQIRARVEQLIQIRAQRAEAEQRSLLTPQDQAALRWIRLRALEAQALLASVEARFVPLTEPEIRQYFEANRDQFNRPKRLDLGAILLTTTDSAPPENASSLGHQLVRDLEGGQISFEQAAREHSQHPSSAAGGRLGWISSTAMSRIYGRKVAKVISGLDVGQLSGLVQEGNKLWIFQLLNTEPARPMTYTEAKVQAENRLGTERSSALADDVRLEWFERLDVSLGAERK